MVAMRSWLAVVALLVAGLVGPGVPATAADIIVPPTGTDVDYQLGGNAPVPDNVGIVVRDRTAAPLAGVYSICYVNGFQTQPNEKRFWRKRENLLLHKNGRIVETPASHERSASASSSWLAAGSFARSVAKTP